MFARKQMQSADVVIRDSQWGQSEETLKLITQFSGLFFLFTTIIIRVAAAAAAAFVHCFIHLFMFPFG